MLKAVPALSAAVIAGWALAGSATGASAGHHHHGCCGPIAPTYHVHNKVIHKHVRRYHDVSRTHYVHRIHRIIDITRIRPIIHISDVTRIHHHKVTLVHPRHEHHTQWLPARKYVTHSYQNTWDCRCHYR